MRNPITKSFCLLQRRDASRLYGVIGCMLMCTVVFGQSEPFSKRTVISSLNSPWEITYGPHDSIWVTESVTYLVKRVSISSGLSTTLLNISSLKNFAAGDGGRWPQGGLMGMALHPNLYSEDPAVRGAKPWVYLAYVYDRPTGQGCSTDPNASGICNFKTRIVRYDYSGNSLSNPVVLLDNMPGSNDHNSGRLTIGPDLKLYYTIGDMGAGQFNNSSRTNNAQTTNVMEGKVLRLNTETDGDAGDDAWVPDDNPFFNGTPITARDYVYSMGHRNAQGLAWATIGSTDFLYSCEHGDKSDDEINIITAGSNYGWNRVSGYCDDNYNGMTLGGYSPVNEGSFCSTTPTNQQPIKTLFTASSSEISGFSSDYLTWPTVAPSSLDVYSSSKIPGWKNSLLITCLKAGRVYRLKLNTTGTGIQNISAGVDTASYFRGEGRFRDLAISPDGLKIYLACDRSGQTSGPTGSFNGGGTPPPNAGAILEFTYTGVILPIRENNPQTPAPEKGIVTVFPNPATTSVKLTIPSWVEKPALVKIFAIDGRILLERRMTQSTNEIDLKSFKPGLYFVELSDAFGKIVFTQKLIRQ